LIDKYLKDLILNKHFKSTYTWTKVILDIRG